MTSTTLPATRRAATGRRTDRDRDGAPSNPTGARRNPPDPGPSMPAGSQQAPGLAPVEARGIIDERSMSSGRPRSFMIALRMRRTGVSAPRPRISPLRHEVEQAGIDPHRHRRRMRRARENIHDVADAVRARIGQVEAAPIRPVQMGQMNQRGDDEIDRHQIDAGRPRSRSSAPRAAAACASSGSA